MSAAARSHPWRERSALAVRPALAFLTCAGAITAAAVLGLPPGYGRAQAQEPQPQPQRPAFRAGVDVVSLNVTVTDGTGHYVTDLRPEDFSVYEDGVMQDVTFFDRSNLPIALSLLLDTSASMEERISTAQEAAIGFAKRLRPQDLGELIDFNTRVEVTQGFTNDVNELDAAIRRTTAGGSTALYNAVYIALKELKKIQVKSADEVRRQAVVVFSDGEDTSSLVTFDQVLDLAKRSETAIYAIGLRPREEILGKGFKEADFVMRSSPSRREAGRSFRPGSRTSPRYTPRSATSSRASLLGYMTKNARRDAWRRVVVRSAARRQPENQAGVFRARSRDISCGADAAVRTLQASATGAAIRTQGTGLP
jgi:Ca-activated chloride channel family protein